jgi:hypothetical protein
VPATPTALESGQKSEAVPPTPTAPESEELGQETEAGKGIEQPSEVL